MDRVELRLDVTNVKTVLVGEHDELHGDEEDARFEEQIVGQAMP